VVTDHSMPVGLGMECSYAVLRLCRFLLIIYMASLELMASVCATDKGLVPPLGLNNALRFVCGNWAFHAVGLGMDCSYAVLRL